MNVLIVFNHPAPYKVKAFNKLAKLVNLDVVFERTRAKDRPEAFYYDNEYHFNVRFLKRGYFGKENTNTRELVTFLKKNVTKYDLVIMNGYSHLTEMRAISYLNKHNIPFTLLINGGIAKKDNFIKAKIKKHFISSAQYFLSPCEEADKYLMNYGAEKNKIFHYPYSTFTKDETLKEPLTIDQKLKLREKYSLPNGKLFICAGQFIKRKNNMNLIRAFEKADAKLVLIGEGKEKKKYLKYIEEHNINNIYIRDFVSKKTLFKMMPCFDGFITLSKEDIFGHTTLEAMACGLPVVSSKHVVSSNTYIKDGLNGFKVDENNTEEILKAINSVESTMPINAIRSIEDNTCENTAKFYFEFIKKVLEK